jgi:hypothetical protein
VTSVVDVRQPVWQLMHAPGVFTVAVVGQQGSKHGTVTVWRRIHAGIGFVHVTGLKGPQNATLISVMYGKAVT